MQGVFFRASAKEHADSLGITGYARNEADGTVSIEAEGNSPQLDQFTAWCKQGPNLAVVESVLLEEKPMQHFDSFSII